MNNSALAKQKQMSGLEKFGLISAIVGLIADGIALTTFFAGLWGTAPANSRANTSGMPFIAQVVLAFGIVYGWVSISWFLTRRRFLYETEENGLKFSGIALRSVIGVGILVVPLAFGWWATIAHEDAVRQQVEIEKRQILRATQTAQALLAPSTAVIPEETTATSIANTEPERADISDYICGAPFAHGLVAISIFLVLTLLMPMVYPDMPDESLWDVLDQFFEEPTDDAA